MLLFFFRSGAQVRHVVLISIDGFRPEMYQDKSWPAPNLRWLVKNGTCAAHMKTVFPAYTHPAHAAMETGALPARSGIAYNQPKNSHGEWFWYYDSIKAPTIWAAIKKKGMTTAAIMWPNTVDGDINYNLSEIWDTDHPGDRATPVRRHAIPRGIYEEIEANATGKLDSTNMNDDNLEMDENTGRMAAYIFKKYKPNFLAMHVACLDGNEHGYGREHDSVRLALAADDRAVGDVLQGIRDSGLWDSTAVIIVGDHGFADFNTVFRPNMLIKNIPAKFIAAGGSAFLYADPARGSMRVQKIIAAVTDSLDRLPDEQRKRFRVVDRNELDRMGADSPAIMALAAVPGLVFSGSVAKNQVVNHGPGTLIQQNPLEGVFIPARGGHHGYDPDLPEMWTGFIAWGTGIRKGGVIGELCVTDIAPLVTRLLGVDFKCPDCNMPEGVVDDKKRKN